MLGGGGVLGKLCVGRRHTGVHGPGCLSLRVVGVAGRQWYISPANALTVFCGFAVPLQARSSHQHKSNKPSSAAQRSAADPHRRGGGGLAAGPAAAHPATRVWGARPAETPAGPVCWAGGPPWRRPYGRQPDRSQTTVSGVAHRASLDPAGAARPWNAGASTGSDLSYRDTTRAQSKPSTRAS